MKQRVAGILLLLAVLAAIIWVARTDPPAPGQQDTPTVAEKSPPQPTPLSPGPLDAPPVVPSPSDSVPPAPGPSLQKQDNTPASPAAKRDLENPLAPASFPLGPPPRSAESEPRTAADLDKVSLMLRDYRTIAGENPVGTNAEIMKVLMGDNAKGAKLGPPEGMSINGEGELTDEWGTPLFFHQLSRDLMEIHSAGPDRRMGTEDDLILK